MSDPIDNAAKAVVEHIMGPDLPDDEHGCCAAVIRNELRKHVSRSVPASLCYDDTVAHSEGYNQCLRDLGLLEEEQ